MTKLQAEESALGHSVVDILTKSPYIPSNETNKVGGGSGEPPNMELAERVGNLETDMRDVRDRLARIEVRLDSFLGITVPTLATKDEMLATKADMHHEFNLQTWRIIGAILAAAGLVFAAARLIP